MTGSDHYLETDEPMSYIPVKWSDLNINKLHVTLKTQSSLKLFNKRNCRDCYSEEHEEIDSRTYASVFSHHLHF